MIWFLTHWPLFALWLGESKFIPRSLLSLALWPSPPQRYVPQRGLFSKKSTELVFCHPWIMIVRMGAKIKAAEKKNHQSVIILIICFSLFHGKRLKDAIFAVEPFLAHFSSTLSMTQQIWWKSSCLHVVHFVQCYTAFSKCKTIFMNMLLPKGLYLNLLRSLYYSYEQR